jgi:HSP20 family protein
MRKWHVHRVGNSCGMSSHSRHGSTDATEGEMVILVRRGRPVPHLEAGSDTDVIFGVGALYRRAVDYAAPWRPPIEVFETRTELVVRAEIGGLNVDDMSIVAEGDQLLIRGSRSVANPDARRVYHESRIRYGNFEAMVLLPFPVEVTGATADYVDGFLTVQLPRQTATRLTTLANSSSGAAHEGGQ